MAEIREVVSERLQSTIRRLLPSQRGFTEDLQASNVITPIIDITPSAEGSSLPDYLQTAVAFGSQTAFDESNSGVVTLINNAGFWRVFGAVSFTSNFANTQVIGFNLNDGSTTKQLYAYKKVSSTAFNELFCINFDFTVFLPANVSLETNTVGAGTNINGTYRQLADVNGVLQDPSGFTAQ